MSKAKGNTRITQEMYDNVFVEAKNQAAHMIAKYLIEFDMDRVRDLVSEEDLEHEDTMLDALIDDTLDAQYHEWEEYSTIAAMKPALGKNYWDTLSDLEDDVAEFLFKLVYPYENDPRKYMSNA